MVGHLLRQQARFHARGQQLAHDGVLPDEPGAVRGGGGRGRRQRDPAEGAHVLLELLQGLGDVGLVQQQRHRLHSARATGAYTSVCEWSAS